MDKGNADGRFCSKLSTSCREVNGKPCWQATIQDITNRKQVEAALKASEERYRLLVDNAFEGIGVGQKGRFVFVNPKLCKITGYSRKELIGRDIFDIVHPRLIYSKELVE